MLFGESAVEKPGDYGQVAPFLVGWKDDAVLGLCCHVWMDGLIE